MEGREKLQVQRSEHRHNSTVLCGLFLLTEKSVLYALNWSKKCCNVQDIYTGINRKIRLMHLTEKRRKYRETRFYMGLLEDRVDG